MIKTLLDKNTDASIRILTSTCVIGIAIALVYSIWRIQLATVTIREIREYAIRRDAEIFPIVHKIGDGIELNREFMGRLDEHMRRQDEDLSKLAERIGKPKTKE